MGSKPFTLDGNDIWKVVKGGLIVGAGAALTYITENIGDIDFGSYTPIVVGGWSVAVNFLRKLLADNTA